MTWHPDMPEEYKNQIVTGEARELAKRIPDESIDLIFTDPVYDRIEDYEWLAKESYRILKDGGSILCFLWSDFMRNVLNALHGNNLIQRGILSLHYLNRVIDSRNKVGINKWTPCVWFSKGDVKSIRSLDLISCKAFAKHYGDGKSNHPWSKPPEFFAYYIEAMSCLESVILDPFVGGGTTSVVCKVLSRNYIAFEIDPDTAELARERVLNTQPPLFVMEPEQLEIPEC